MGQKKYKTRKVIVGLLSDGKPHTAKEFIKALGIAAYQGLSRTWQSGLIFRTEYPVRQNETVLSGRLGKNCHLVMYHKCLLIPPNFHDNSLVVDGVKYVRFDRSYLDSRGAGDSKSDRIRSFLLLHKDRAWFSRELRDEMSSKLRPGEREITASDIMSTLRHDQRKRRCCDRGHAGNDEDGSKPFQRGFCVVWFDPELPHVKALEKAINLSESPVMRRRKNTVDAAHMEHSRNRAGEVQTG